jgi:hypothetical protein
MIDASTFATQYNSFWGAFAPTTEHFVRRLNAEHIERFETPLDYEGSAHSRALIAEIAFRIFVENGANYKKNGRLDINKEYFSETTQKTKNKLAPMTQNSGEILEELSNEEIKHCLILSLRLCSFFSEGSVETIFEPTFPGCGFIDASQGDVFWGNDLYEIKTVDRPFRGIDIKQLITYSALNYGAKGKIIKNIGLTNPRRGVFFLKELDYVCFEISGLSKEDLFETILDSVSNSEISR